MTDTATLTDARRRALEVLLAAERAGGQARESNVTDLGRHTVYWQTLRWLEREALATCRVEGGQLFIRLTDAGRQLAGEVAAR